jgi:hypothetical protein
MGKSTNKIQKVLKPTIGDTAHMVAKASLGAIPYAGGLAAELLNYVIIPPLEKRKAEWMRNIEERLRKLEAEGVNIKGLQDNPEFVDVVLQASQAILRTSVEEKKKALANAVVNAAKGQGVTGAKRQMFFTFIDQFNEWHLRLLNLAANTVKCYEAQGKKWPDFNMGAFSTVVEGAFSELFNQREFYDIIWKDLSDRGLVRTPNIHIAGSGEGMKENRATNIGAEFLAFIAE